MTTTLQSEPGEAPLIADDLALDMLNTEAGIGDSQRDSWHDADAVLAWLGRCGIDAGTDAKSVSADFLCDATALRAIARDLITLRKQGERGDPAPLNRYLEALASTPVLEWKETQPQLARRGAGASPERALGILAESVAALLAEGEFSLVRQCEHPECVLWFYDRTKSHRRRWCSMALCGNRHKAAEFRKRTKLAA
ncbi:CGNR zinc finger domain-containing protein [Massilia aurea]|uniref:CGNR zinc finger domain-containing protein n=1 Tax=Massilia aurea TaxID=373040 RepID=UPI0034620500